LKVFPSGRCYFCMEDLIVVGDLLVEWQNLLILVVMNWVSTIWEYPRLHANICKLFLVSWMLTVSFWLCFCRCWAGFTSVNGPNTWGKS
jgi:hypothetical protein